MIAEDFVRQYHHLTVPEFQLRPFGPTELFGANSRSAPVREYSNSRFSSRHGLSYAERLKLKDLLLYTFLPRMTKKSEKSGVFKNASGYSFHNSAVPIRDMPAKTFQRVFGGKGSPVEMAQVIQIINFWRGYLTLLEGKEVPELNLIVEQYLGMDCNGFVGNYLMAKYPGLGVDPNNPEEIYHNKAKKNGVIRKSIQDLKEDDILIFDGHIAIISRVLAKASNSAMVAVSESRTRHQVHGGPQTNSLHMEYSSGGFKLSGRDPLLAIVRLQGM
jgi:hypothetical protein